MRHRLPLVLSATALAVAVLGAAPFAGAVGRIVLPPASVGAIHLKKNAVTAAKVADGTLTRRDFARGELPGPGLSGFERIGASSTFDSSPVKKVVLTCPSGKKVLAGGGGAWLRAMVDVPSTVAVTASHALYEDTWLVAARELTPTDQDWYIVANAVCVVVT